MKKKKAELTTQQIVILIILITSFAVILFLLFRLNLGETTSKEVCHNSVVLKGNSALSQEAVSLNCYTKYLCITADGSCEQMIKPEIEKVKDKEDIYQVLADEMADCWWMFGEGKVDYVGGKMLKKNYCSICSQIAFDDSLKKDEEKYGIKEGNLNKNNFYEYLSKTKIPGKQINYLEYFTGTNDLDLIKQSTLESLEKEGVFGNININNRYYVVMGIASNVGYKWKIVQAVGIATGVVSLFTPAGWITGVVFFAGATTAIGAAGGETIAFSSEPEILAYAREGNGISNKFMVPTIIEVDPEVFKSLKCEEILTFQ